ncbi:Tether containing UBX domain for GLUT4 [Allomyces arbusculus]|nr:Tether containing UBX domain for GLUT4 [Allomyces arbusculus]
MSASLVVATPDGKRATVKTTPAMPLKEVVATAVATLRLGNPDAWGLQRANARAGSAALDLSLSVRFANLPSGAKLELVPRSARVAQRAANAPVTVALQLDGGARTVDSYSASTTLWEVLRQVEERSKGTLNLTRRTGHPKEGSSKLLDKIKATIGDDQYMIPTLLVLNKEITTIEALQSTTLASLGLQGNVLIRLMFKYSGQSLAEVEPLLDRPVASNAPAAPAPEPSAAAPVTPTPTPAADPSSRPTTASSTVAQPAPTPAPAPQPSAPAPPRTPEPPRASATVTGSASAQTPVPSAAVAEHDDALVELDRDLTLYLPPTENSMLNIQLPDSFFELSSTELKAMVKASDRRRQERENAPLKTKAMRDREVEARRRKHPKTLIRVRFPDLYQLQAVFLSTERVGDVYDVVRSAMHPALLARNPIVRLFTTAPRTFTLPTADEDMSFWDAELAPAGVVHCTVQADGVAVVKTVEILSAELVEAARALPQQVVDVAGDEPMAVDQPEEMGGRVGPGFVGDEDRPRPLPPSSSLGSLGSSGSGPKLPKWLKLGKK